MPDRGCVVTRVVSARSSITSRRYRTPRSRGRLRRARSLRATARAAAVTNRLFAVLDQRRRRADENPKTVLPSRRRPGTRCGGCASRRRPCALPRLPSRLLQRCCSSGASKPRPQVPLGIRARVLKSFELLWRACDIVLSTAAPHDLVFLREELLPACQLEGRRRVRRPCAPPQPSRPSARDGSGSATSPQGSGSAAALSSRLHLRFRHRLG